MHAMESTLHAGWASQRWSQQVQGELQEGQEQLLSSEFMEAASWHCRYEACIRKWSLAQSQPCGAQIQRSWQGFSALDFLCCRKTFPQSWSTWDKVLLVMGSMSPGMFVQARRLSELSFFFSHFSLLFSGQRKGLVAILKPTCVTSTHKENICTL